MNLLKNKLILLYDNDTNKPEENFDPLFIRKMSKNEFNGLYKKGIESLFTSPKTFIKNYENFYDEKNETGDMGRKKNNQTFNKMKLCNYICNEVPLDDKKQLFRED